MIALQLGYCKILLLAIIKIILRPYLVRFSKILPRMEDMLRFLKNMAYSGGTYDTTSNGIWKCDVFLLRTAIQSYSQNCVLKFRNEIMRTRYPLTFVCVHSIHSSRRNDRYSQICSIDDSLVWPINSIDEIINARNSRWNRSLDSQFLYKEKNLLLNQNNLSLTSAFCYCSKTIVSII